MRAREFDALEAAPAGTRCPLCGGDAIHNVLHVPRAPIVCNQLLADVAAARAAELGDIRLAVCADCTLVFNRSFSEERITYAAGYENALHYSPKFRDFARSLCANLVARHDLQGRDVVELGCGDGYVLDLMITSGVRRATGFDPSMAGVASPFAVREGVEIVPEYFRASHLDRSFAFLLCRHVLEHLPHPASLVKDIRAAVGDDGSGVYFEVPNAQWILEDVSLWDVIYEHVTYWTPASLETLFRRAGFAPISIRTGYGGQFLMIEARPTITEPDFLPKECARAAAADACRHFTERADALLAEWRATMRVHVEAGRCAVVWGAGSKGIMFANVMEPDAACVVAMVDVNARKHGRFVPGAALPVVAPSAVPALEPDLVVVANGLYVEEIGRSVNAQGCFPEFRVLAG